MEIKDFIQERCQKTFKVNSVTLFSDGSLSVDFNENNNIYLNEIESVKIEYDSDSEGIRTDVTPKKEDSEAAQLESR